MFIFPGRLDFHEVSTAGKFQAGLLERGLEQFVKGRVFYAERYPAVERNSGLPDRLFIDFNFQV